MDPPSRAWPKLHVVRPLYLNIFGLTTQPGPLLGSCPGSSRTRSREVIFGLDLTLWEDQIQVRGLVLGISRVWTYPVQSLRTTTISLVLVDRGGFYNLAKFDFDPGKIDNFVGVLRLWRRALIGGFFILLLSKIF